MDRKVLVALFKSVDATEAAWALETLAEDTAKSVATDDLHSISDCLCKINDHANGDENWLKETEAAEAVLVKLLFPNIKS